MATLLAKPLPKFLNPPVIETVLALQFNPIPDFTNAHLGAFWSAVADEWPFVSDAPKLDPEFEVFDAPAIWQPSFQIRLGRDAAGRVQMRNKNRTRMLQVQNGRLIYNWVAQTDQEYPSYGKILPEFEKTLERFQEYLRAQKFNSIRFNQWEITYINHIPQGSVWETPLDWPRLFKLPIATSATPEVPARLVGLSGEWHFEIEPQRGRLHIQLMHGLESIESKRELLVLKLTARGPISNSEVLTPHQDGFDLGHATIVQSFDAVTSADAHTFWRRQS